MHLPDVAYSGGPAVSLCFPPVIGPGLLQSWRRTMCRWKCSHHVPPGVLADQRFGGTATTVHRPFRAALRRVTAWAFIRDYLHLRLHIFPIHRSPGDVMLPSACCDDVSCRPRIWRGPPLWTASNDAHDEWGHALAHLCARPRLPHALSARCHATPAARPWTPPPHALPGLQPPRPLWCLGRSVSLLALLCCLLTELALPSCTSPFIFAAALPECSEACTSGRYPRRYPAPTHCNPVCLFLSSGCGAFAIPGMLHERPPIILLLLTSP